ncbi:nucleoside deaminase [Saxibacter everestensis]|uniref:Nucleoside deaminase n=1 Tax=Saxibacter everestensis TaxID=2909229 RepID=A0ABY8QQZ2_9MICO|nr:nucleoside deaminase [Brevibacteriaceae bacterium ZFBP1038]
MTSPTDDQHVLSHALNLAVANVHDRGGPFGAVIVAADGSRHEGVNRVTADNDPTAHAEVSAIRNACQTLGTFDLTGATLYTSCEPCPMCLSSALWARVERVVFAADRHDAANAGFDDANFYDYFDIAVEDRPMPVRHLQTEEIKATAPFEAWNTLAARIDY